MVDNDFDILLTDITCLLDGERKERKERRMEMKLTRKAMMEVK